MSDVINLSIAETHIANMPGKLKIRIEYLHAPNPNPYHPKVNLKTYDKNV